MTCPAGKGPHKSVGDAEENTHQHLNRPDRALDLAAASWACPSPCSRNLQEQTRLRTSPLRCRLPALPNAAASDLHRGQWAGSVRN